MPQDISPRLGTPGDPRPDSQGPGTATDLTESARDAALSSVERGFSIVPSGRTSPNTPIMPWKDQNGEGWPSKDRDMVATGFTHKFRGHPHAVVCGPSGIWVVDMDPPKPGKKDADGRETFNSLMAEHGIELPDTLTVRSPSGGFHLYFTNHSGIRNSENKIAPSVDIRGNGGVIAGPGSAKLTDAGVRVGTYEIINDAPIADAPEALTALALAANRSNGAEGSAVDADTVETWLAGRAPGPASDHVRRSLDSALRDIKSNGHGTTNDHVWNIVGYGSGGHPGVPEALDKIKDALIEYRDGDEITAEAEFFRSVAGAIGKFQTKGITSYDVYLGGTPNQRETEPLRGTVSVDRLLEVANQESKPAETSEAEKVTLGTRQARLLETVRQNYDLFLGNDGFPYAVPRTGPKIIRKVNSGLLNKISTDIYESTGTLISASDKENVAETLKAYALQTDPVMLDLRCARVPSGIEVDLGDTTGRAVHIGGKGWEIIDRPHSMFRRSSVSNPIPEPVRGGSVNELRALLKLEDDAQWRVVLGWLVASFFPDIPRPILIFTGVQGSGKTERARLVKSILDPADALSPEPGRNLRDDQITTSARYLVGFDNLSKVSATVSDMLCRLVTGESYQARTLYSDADVTSVSYLRTGVATGINMPTGLRPDALERFVRVDLHRMPESSRDGVRSLWQQFAEVHPRVLGALLDLLSSVVRGMESGRTNPRPLRMADYSDVLFHLGPEYLGAYRADAEEAFSDMAESNPLVSALRSVFDNQGNVRTSYSDLLNMINTAYFAENNSIRPPEWWPTTPRALSDALNRESEPMRSAGITFRSGRSNGRRFVRLFSIDTEDETA